MEQHGEICARRSERGIFRVKKEKKRNAPEQADRKAPFFFFKREVRVEGLSANWQGRLLFKEEESFVNFFLSSRLSFPFFPTLDIPYIC